MKNFKVKDLLIVLFNVRKTMSEEEWENLPIVLGDDEELNGVHEAYFVQDVDTTEVKGYTWNDIQDKTIDFDEYCKYSLQQDIKDTTDINGKCILIS